MITIDDIKVGDKILFIGWDGERTVAKVIDKWDDKIEINDYEETIICEKDFKKLKIEVHEK